MNDIYRDVSTWNSPLLGYSVFCKALFLSIYSPKRTGHKACARGIAVQPFAAIGSWKCMVAMQLGKCDQGLTGFTMIHTIMGITYAPLLELILSWFLCWRGNRITFWVESLMNMHLPARQLAAWDMSDPNVTSL